MAAGSIVKNVVEYIVTQIVEDTKSVKVDIADSDDENVTIEVRTCLLYTSPSPRDDATSRMPSSA